MRRLGAGGPFFLGIIGGCLLILAFFSWPEKLLSRSADAGPFEVRAAADGGRADARPAGDGLAADAMADPFRSSEAEFAEAIRIRILAHSNSEEDQEIKRRVRDRVMALIESWRPSPKTNAEMREMLQAHLGEIEEAANGELARWGAAYGARAMYGNVPFPAKTFAGRELPAGEYEGLLITLGDGNGDNWWCMLFPPLCLAGAVAKDEEADHRKETASNPRTAGPMDQPKPQNGKTVQPAPKATVSGKADPAPKALAHDKSGSAAKPEKGAARRDGDAGTAEKPRVKFLLWELLQRFADFLKKLFSG